MSLKCNVHRRVHEHNTLHEKLVQKLKSALEKVQGSLKCNRENCMQHNRHVKETSNLQEVGSLLKKLGVHYAEWTPAHLPRQSNNKTK